MRGKTGNKELTNKHAGIIPAFRGLFARLVLASVVIGCVTLALVVSLFGFYLDRLATDEAKWRLERSIAVLAPVIDGANFD